MAIFGEPKDAKGSVNGSYFGNHFRPKVEKRHPKINAKIDAEKVWKNDARMTKK